MIQFGPIDHFPGTRRKHADLWPKILHINPDTGTQTRLPIANSLTIDGGLGNSVVYELVGTISHDAHREHWTSKFLLGNTTFHYDDLNRGSLVAQGPVDLITAPDMTAVLWAYHRSSKVTETRKSFQETVAAYQKAFEEESNRPKSPPIDVPESPVPKANTGFALPVVPHADLDTPILNPAIFSPKVVASPPAQWLYNSRLCNGIRFPPPRCAWFMALRGLIVHAVQMSNLYGLHPRAVSTA
ncbi:hypothetical protein K438DRAFT_1780282 [Mycena galopus ATCC 62051]|nr:hypothetical protein K438DRAFT_1780282 [Mycena galopus ATCC 62051]